MLNQWRTYLLENFEKVKRIEDFGALYEQFIATFPQLRKEWALAIQGKSGIPNLLFVGKIFVFL